MRHQIFTFLVSLFLVPVISGPTYGQPESVTTGEKPATNEIAAVGTPSAKSQSTGENASGKTEQGDSASLILSTESSSNIELPSTLQIQPFRQPLSLKETLSLVRESITWIPAETEISDETTLELSRTIQSCTEYLKFRNDLHTSLADYEWYHLGDDKVQNNPGNYDEDTFYWDPPVKNLNAISLNSLYGDVYIDMVKVFDDQGSVKFSFSDPNPKVLRNLLPRREVFHLWSSTDVQEIRIRYRKVKADPNLTPKVILRGGVAHRPEYIKTAIWNLTNSQGRIREKNWVEARVELQSAASNISDYLRFRQTSQ